VFLYLQYQIWLFANVLANSKLLWMHMFVVFLFELPNVVVCKLVVQIHIKHYGPTTLQPLWHTNHFPTIPAQCCAGVIATMLHYETHAILLLPSVPTILTAQPSHFSTKPALTA
jgi:hypothetical protein